MPFATTSFSFASTTAEISAMNGGNVIVRLSPITKSSPQMSTLSLIVLAST
jgi:hypothetical protein